MLSDVLSHLPSQLRSISKGLEADGCAVVVDLNAIEDPPESRKIVPRREPGQIDSPERDQPQPADPPAAALTNGRRKSPATPAWMTQQGPPATNGRGRAATMPAWMTQKQMETPTERAAAPETLAASTMRAASPLTTNGRGRGATIPAWMSKEQPEKSAPARMATASMETTRPTATVEGDGRGMAGKTPPSWPKHERQKPSVPATAPSYGAPRGRGRGATIPAWMKKQQPTDNDKAIAPVQNQPPIVKGRERDVHGVSRQQQPPRPLGRGRAATTPAWMSARSDHTPALRQNLGGSPQPPMVHTQSSSSAAVGDTTVSAAVNALFASLPGQDTAQQHVMSTEGMPQDDEATAKARAAAAAVRRRLGLK